jgi:glycosyltransferase involved in cell wall biosynthesis
MRILIILKRWTGGVGVVVQNLKRELEKQNHYVKIISREDDLRVYSLLKSILILRKKIKELMKKENYDIIYTQDWSIAFPLFFPYPLFRKKHFCCFHGIEPSILGRLFQNLIGKIMHRNLIVVGDVLKAKFPKANLIYNGVDLNLFRPNKKKKRIKNSVGFANWPTDEYNFTKIMLAVKKAGKKLIIAKNIPYEKMPEFYNKIETFISLPPRYTGFNLVWFEAMATGVPKIIGNRYGIGKKLPIDKIENFPCLEDAILNAKKRNYRKWLINNKFTWEAHVNKLLNVINSSYHREHYKLQKNDQEKINTKIYESLIC